jgi:type I restriction enzyme S subunit
MNAQQLKNAILQEAIEGRLVPQDPNDEPASILLERIRAEKERLVREGKLKKKDLEIKPISEDEKPFDIPESWEWVRIGSIFSMQAGKNVTAADIKAEKSEKFPYQCYGGNGIRGYVAKYNTTGCFPLVGRQGALCGNVNIAEGNFWATEHAVVTKGFGLTEILWQYYFLTALNLNKLATATAQPGLAVSNVIESLIPLPPLAEQKRIVAKIEELLPKVEEFGKAQETLNKLNEELPDRLKKSILQEAITGRLVPQDPNDEPASVLLDKIRAEKKQLVKEGKLKKKDLEETPISEDEKPFEIPESWEWVRLGDLVLTSTGKTPARGDSKYWDKNKYPWVSISDMRQGEYVNNTKEFISQVAADECFHGDISKKGTLIMSFKLTVGRTSILGIDAYHNEAIISIKTIADKNNNTRDYLSYILPIIANWGESKDAIKGKTLNSKSIYNLFIPLPPLAEQKRIVAKIEELFAVLDSIKESLEA